MLESRAMRANKVYVPTCLRASVVYVPTCQKRANFFFTCQRANNRANVPNGMPIFQLGVPTCQKACQFFKHSSYETRRGNFYTLLFYEKIYILLDIIVIKIICRCIVNKNGIILYFYTSCCHIKEKGEEFFYVFFLFCSLVRN